MSLFVVPHNLVQFCEQLLAQYFMVQHCVSRLALTCTWRWQLLNILFSQTHCFLAQLRIVYQQSTSAVPILKRKLNKTILTHNIVNSCYFQGSFLIVFQNQIIKNLKLSQSSRSENDRSNINVYLCIYGQLKCCA